jgi:hypothetical protein
MEAMHVMLVNSADKRSDARRSVDAASNATDVADVAHVDAANKPSVDAADTDADATDAANAADATAADRAYVYAAAKAADVSAATESSHMATTTAAASLRRGCEQARGQ